MKSTKKMEELDEMTSSVMRWGSGEEVICYLDWDERWFYLWIEPTWNFIDFCEETGGEMRELMEALNIELANMGVQQFYDLDSVNKFCASFCGDNEPAEFYIDEWGWVCGA